jgi:hypothetical protein
MWRWRVIRVVMMLAGAATLAFLACQSADPRMNAASITTFGMPGTLLVGMVAIILFAVGAGR